MFVKQIGPFSVCTFFRFDPNEQITIYKDKKICSLLHFLSLRFSFYISFLFTGSLCIEKAHLPNLEQQKEEVTQKYWPIFLFESVAS